MENKILEKAKKLYFIAVAVAMYYFLNEYFDLGLHVTHRHAFALVLAFSAILLFMIKPNIARGVTVFKEACVYSTPLALQVLLNVGVVTNLLPSTGISMPFFSSGGTALMMQLAECGIMLNISRSISQK